MDCLLRACTASLVETFRHIQLSIHGLRVGKTEWACVELTAHHRELKHIAEGREMSAHMLLEHTVNSSQQGYSQLFANMVCGCGYSIWQAGNGNGVQRNADMKMTHLMRPWLQPVVKTCQARGGRIGAGKAMGGNDTPDVLAAAARRLRMHLITSLLRVAKNLLLSSTSCCTVAQNYFRSCTTYITIVLNNKGLTWWACSWCQRALAVASSCCLWRASTRRNRSARFCTSAASFCFACGQQYAICMWL